MPIHPEYEIMLRQLAEMEGPDLVDLPVSIGREMYRAMQPEAFDVEVGAVSDVDAGGVPARVYRPQGDGPFPGGHDVPRRRLGDRRPRHG